MKNYNLEKDIHVMCSEATSFPGGVFDAYKKLQACVPNSKERRYFGISHLNKDGSIVYKACVEVGYDGEALKLELEPFVIKAGNFASIYIEDFMKNHDAISSAFQELLRSPNIDPQGYCLEMYINSDTQDVLCLVPLQ